MAARPSGATADLLPQRRRRRRPEAFFEQTLARYRRLTTRALLDEEIAAGIVAANQVRQRLQKERRIDPRDFREALQRFQRDGHEVVDLIDHQLAELRSKENAELTTRLLHNAHDLLDLAVGLVNMGAEIAGQVAQANLPKNDGGSTQRRNR